MKRKMFIPAAAALSVLIAFALSEIILRAIKWQPIRKSDGYMQFGYRTGIPLYDEDGLLKEGEPVRVRLFQYDRELFWKPIPDTGFTNGAGFRGREEISPVKGPGTIRIGILGDSCSFLGEVTYPEVLQELLSEKFPSKKFEVINASVPGYTSYQGKKRLEDILPFHPDYVCVYFGWNDHWVIPSGFTDDFHSSLSRGSRVVNLLKLSWHRLSKAGGRRVPQDDFCDNLREIIEALGKRGVTPVLITAPTGFRAGNMPEWAYSFFSTFYRMDADDIGNIPGMHEEYAGAVREIGKKEDVILVDALDIFKKKADAPAYYFRTDMIHLRDAGHKLLAAEIARELISDINRR